jgi:23S rRNA pseudouridine2605 synthase
VPLSPAPRAASLAGAVFCGSRDRSARRRAGSWSDCPAAELATRLIAAGRAVPLNLLGTFSEQPDFLVTPEVLPWVAAIRGDRQWKLAPAGRTAPIVVRTWGALDERGERTAVEIRELLGRELTEAAVLRALIELWTTLRAAPAYAGDEPTRWSLLKSRYARQLATAANTALPTALSALLSIYLRSAVAATAEEAEIFLSPLTARSRIREVLHGMTAARQFGTLSLASHTLLFVEGSLPETPAEPAPEAAPATAPDEDRARREAIRRQSPEDRERPPRREPRATRPSFGGKPAPRREFSAKRPPFRGKPEARPNAKPRSGGTGDRPFSPRRDDRPRFQRRDDSPERAPRENRPPSKFAPRRDDRGPAQFRPRRDERPAAKFGSERRERFEPARGEKRPWQKDRPRPFAKPGDRRRVEGRPRFEKREREKAGFAPPRRKPFPAKPESAGAFDRGPRPDSPRGGKRPDFPKSGNRPAFRKSGDRPDYRKSGPDFRKSGARPADSRGPREGRPGRPESRGPRPFGAGKFRSGPAQKPRGEGSSRFGKGPGKARFETGKGRPRPAPDRGKSSRFGGPRSPRKNFPQSSAPRDRNPRKNRSQDENPE